MGALSAFFLALLGIGILILVQRLLEERRCGSERAQERKPDDFIARS